MQRGRERERAGEKPQCVVASCAHPIGDLARNPGVCPDWEPATLWFAAQHSIHGATAARAGLFLKREIKMVLDALLLIHFLHIFTDDLQNAEHCVRC